MTGTAPMLAAAPALGGDHLAAACSSTDVFARLRIALTYGWRHGRMPRIREPRLFTEWVQHRKLYDRDPRLPQLADKVMAKRHVAAILGPEWVTPTLWHGLALPPAIGWPAPFVVKSRHGSNQSVFVRSTDVDWPLLRRRTRRWMAGRYGWWLDEWLYGEIPRGLLIEPFIGSGGVLPIDYKFYVFGGRVHFIQVHLARETAHRWVVLDRHWRPQRAYSDHPAPPVSLPAMIEAAERLGHGLPFVRVDLYEISGRPRFGEFTFYPGSGLDPFDPPQLDETMGRLWLEARDGLAR